MDYGIILAALLLLFLIYIVVRIMHKPIRWTMKLIVNCAIAIVGIMFFNVLGGFVGFHLPLNPVSVLGVGVLGVPGMALLIFMNFLMT